MSNGRDPKLQLEEARRELAKCYRQKLELLRMVEMCARYFLGNGPQPTPEQMAQVIKNAEAGHG